MHAQSQQLTLHSAPIANTEQVKINPTFPMYVLHSLHG